MKRVYPALFAIALLAAHADSGAEPKTAPLGAFSCIPKFTGPGFTPREAGSGMPIRLDLRKTAVVKNYVNADKTKRLSVRIDLLPAEPLKRRKAPAVVIKTVYERKTSDGYGVAGMSTQDPIELPEEPADEIRLELASPSAEYASIELSCRRSLTPSGPVADRNPTVAGDLRDTPSKRPPADPGPPGSEGRQNPQVKQGQRPH